MLPKPFLLSAIKWGVNKAHGWIDTNNLPFDVEAFAASKVKINAALSSFAKPFTMLSLVELCRMTTFWWKLLLQLIQFLKVLEWALPNNYNLALQDIKFFKNTKNQHKTWFDSIFWIVLDSALVCKRFSKTITIEDGSRRRFD